MDNLGNNVLAYAAFSKNQHSQIYRRHLQGDVECIVQCLAVSYDVIALFDVLEFRILHLGRKVTTKI